jgi:hypothetical protein
MSFSKAQEAVQPSHDQTFLMALSCHLMLMLVQKLFFEKNVGVSFKIKGLSTRILKENLADNQMHSITLQMSYSNISCLLQQYKA